MTPHEAPPQAPNDAAPADVALSDAVAPGPTAAIGPTSVPAADAPGAPRADHPSPVLCPMCEYDLRGLPEPRCPECGFRFTWQELLDPRRALHPYLFELHPERNLWSFCRTLIGALRPRRFWRQIHPGQPSDPRRLVLFGLVIAALCLVPGVLDLAVLAYRFDQYQLERQQAAAATITPALAAWAVPRHGSIQGYLDAAYPRFGSPWFTRMLMRSYSRRPMVLVAGGLVAWSALTFAALMIFQASMRRARVRPHHVLRCAIYSGSVVLPFAALLSVMIALEFFAGPPTSEARHRLVATGLLFLLPLLFACRLAVAYRHYMRFDHAVATAAATQVMLFLLALKVALDCDVIR